MIMSASKFHKRKNFFSSGHKNPISADIYTLLGAFESANTPNKKLKIMVLLYFLCLEYEWGKFGTKGASKKEEKNNLVLVLKREIEAEVDQPWFKQAYSNKLAGESYKGGVQRAAAGTGTQLKGAYGTESIAPRSSDSNKYGLNTKIPAFGMSLLTQEIEADFQNNQNMQGAQSAKAAHDLISNMSMTDLFKELHKMWGNSNLKHQQFSFFDSSQRQQYMATYNNGAWSCNGHTPYTTGADWGNTTAKRMYVMDMAHRLYIPDGIGTGTGQFNHSSMLAGKPVLCAGEVKINGVGKLTYIDNNSGHYKPNANALKEVVRALRTDYGIPFHGIDVMDQGSQRTMSALRFLQS